ncbi:MAG: methyltransferase domain-containing protein [Gemmatimonadaceae bacterium]|nr:methyltransferase domain-containing protein [Gloeobacterales cyanobacterium ES-bin-141]
MTSLCEVYHEKTEVFFCSTCSHLQTTEISDLQGYYDTIYKILIDSEEEDQLYSIEGNIKVFRVEHQAKTLLEKIDLIQGARVLDYGCAKAATMKCLSRTRPDLKLYLYDVSSMYVPFWERFIQSSHWSTYTIEQAWFDSFDVVTSFFALEHVASPVEMLSNVLRLLKPGGVFYCIVPNVYTNIADFVVLDHVNHFSDASLLRLFNACGFVETTIDDASHRGAFVVVARKPDGASSGVPEPSANGLNQQCHAIAAYWSDITQRIAAFEADNQGTPSIIYGSGFYGTFLAACLTNLDLVYCFVDRNPFRQGKTLLDKPIVSPEELPDKPFPIYVGLNPSIARQSIEDIRQWQGRPYSYFFP